MLTNPLSAEFAHDLYTDDAIVDYEIHMRCTDQEVICLTSHSDKIATLTDDEDYEGMISYSIYTGTAAYEYGDWEYIGAVADKEDREKFLELFK